MEEGSNSQDTKLIRKAGEKEQALGSYLVRIKE